VIKQRISFAFVFFREPIMVFEGQEKDEFWNHFPHGKEPYASDKRLGEYQSSLTSTNDHPARLYEISNASGYTTAIEIPNFTQVHKQTKSCYWNFDRIFM